MSILGLVALSDAGAAALVILIGGLFALACSVIGYWLVDRWHVHQIRKELRDWTQEGHGGYR